MMTFQKFRGHHVVTIQIIGCITPYKTKIHKIHCFLIKNTLIHAPVFQFNRGPPHILNNVLCQNCPLFMARKH